MKKCVVFVLSTIFIFCSGFFVNAMEGGATAEEEKCSINFNGVRSHIIEKESFEKEIEEKYGPSESTKSSSPYCLYYYVPSCFEKGRWNSKFKLWRKCIEQEIPQEVAAIAYMAILRKTFDDLKKDLKKELLLFNSSEKKYSDKNDYSDEYNKMLEGIEKFEEGVKSFVVHGKGFSMFRDKKNLMSGYSVKLYNTEKQKPSLSKGKLEELRKKFEGTEDLNYEKKMNEHRYDELTAEEVQRFEYGIYEVNEDGDDNKECSNGKCACGECYTDEFYIDSLLCIEVYKEDDRNKCFVEKFADTFEKNANHLPLKKQIFLDGIDYIKDFLNSIISKSEFNSACKDLVRNRFKSKFEDLEKMRNDIENLPETEEEFKKSNFAVALRNIRICC